MYTKALRSQDPPPKWERSEGNVRASSKQINKAVRELTHDLSYHTGSEYRNPSYAVYETVDTYLQHPHRPITLEKLNTDSQYGTIYTAHGPYPLDRDFAILKTVEEDMTLKRLIVNQGVFDEKFVEDYIKARKDKAQGWKWFSQFRELPNTLLSYEEIRKRKMDPVPTRDVEDRIQRILSSFPMKKSGHFLGNTNELYREYIIGRRLNELKKEIPYFLWTFPMLREWKLDTNNYLMIEAIPYPQSLLDVDQYELCACLYRVVGALMFAREKLGFYHNDVHLGNVLLKVTPNAKFTIHNVEYPSNFTPYIIDYGMSSLEGVESEFATTDSLTGDISLLLSNLQAVQPIPFLAPIMKLLSGVKRKDIFSNGTRVAYMYVHPRDVEMEIGTRILAQLEKLLQEFSPMKYVPPVLSDLPAVSRIDDILIRAGEYYFSKPNPTKLYRINEYVRTAMVDYKVVKDYREMKQRMREQYPALITVDGSRSAIHQKYVQAKREIQFSYILEYALQQVARERKAEVIYAIFCYIKIYEDSPLNMFDASMLVLASVSISMGYSFSIPFVNEKYLDHLIQTLTTGKHLLIDKKTSERYLSHAHVKTIYASDIQMELITKNWDTLEYAFYKFNEML